MKKKNLALLLALVLVVGGVVGGTMAWLFDQTDSVVNTFTDSDIDITLVEDVDTDKNGAESFKMVPGYTIKKDPVVTVLANSEKCFLFVKLAKSGGDITVKENGENVTKSFDSFLSYDMAKKEDGTNVWTQLNGVTDKDGNPVDTSNVWYIVVDSSAEDQKFHVLNDDQVTVQETVTKDMMNALNTSNYPTLTVTAYASQFYKNNNATGNSFTAAEAWKNISGS